MILIFVDCFSNLNFLSHIFLVSQIAEQNAVAMMVVLRSVIQEVSYLDTLVKAVDPVRTQ